ncbi:hypothetical protein [Photorhabdus bodei]|uniref:Uncharacterized protein n=1 Tax=Photorhabdus bodei TaxID=2029681 RepID=A0ABX0AHN0_9GAMM|nr:hypothetical protein [Photorhabdus bodei]NDK98229.1 hypothetical protein [Photorhabdus bodei]NDL02479.1 hypothetical protein [Photorhabdus bodei]NDL06553.1 hypothetical protein [Photorhabdus bodei]
MTGVSECSQQRGNLKDDGYKRPHTTTIQLTSTEPHFLNGVRQQSEAPF